MVLGSAMAIQSNGNGVTTSAKFEQCTSLQQTIELLQILEKKSNNKEMLAKELDTKENILSHFISFLQDMRWIKEDSRDLWNITEEGGIWLHRIQSAMENRKSI